ncbi:MAG: anthranilate synthase component I family protein [Crocinitomicaceae bacterium]
MKKRYYQIIGEFDPIEFIQKYNPSAYALNENGESNYILGYTKNDSNIFKIKTKEHFLKLELKSEYCFGYIPYEVKNMFLPGATSNNKEIHGIKEASFFYPEGVVISKNGHLIFYGTADEHQRISTVSSLKIKTLTNKSSIGIIRKAWTEKNTYLKNVSRIKNHIQNGEIYEMNYCLNYEFSNINKNSFNIYKKLKTKTNAPFSSKLHIDKLKILSASPERFIKKSDNVLSSQPIKGTIKRGKTAESDLLLIEQLKNDQKEIAENVMIVDLVRNDLSKIANKSSVIVKELCKLYSFKTVHQLISTVECTVNNKINILKILEALFPMGSMTGAPKLSATDIINEFENFNREVYSGAIGFVSPNGSFDFNVVIRSIIINTRKNNASIAVGSAITIKSKAELEYQECLLKLEAIQSALV